MDRVITIGGREVPMRANAATPRYYRERFGRDLLVDLGNLVGSWSAGRDGSGEVLEDLAYTMARQADPTIPEDIIEWLEGFDPACAVSDASDDLLALWAGNTRTTATAKKN